MSERVFADDFRKGFFKEDDFLEFLDCREENAGWEKAKSNELRFFAMEEGHFVSSMLEEDLRQQKKNRCFWIPWNIPA